MPVDESWLAITKVYAIVAIAAVCVLTAAMIHLGVKARHLVRAAKLKPKLAAQQSKRTGDLLRRRGEAMVSRGQRVGAAFRSSFGRIAAKLRAARDLIEH